MDVVKLPGLFLRGTTWWVRKDVPKVLRPIIRLTSMQRSLETSDFKIAVIRYHRMMAEFQQRLIDAREQPTVSSFPYIIQNSAGVIDYSKPMRSKPSISMFGLFEQWKEERRPAQNTVAEYQLAMEQFIELNGAHQIVRYTTEHARAWKQYVGRRNRSHATLEKQFGALVTLFLFAERNELDSSSPFDNVSLERPKRAIAQKREEWSTEELQVLFGSRVYTERYRPRYGEIAFWAAPLALFHGLRAGEICQLDRADFVQRNGIACLLVRPSDEDEGRKSVKTAESVRTVPLHRRVLDLGWVDYSRSLRGTKMFPGIEPDTRGRWSGHFTKWFGRYRRSIGLDQRWVDFHSFRHSWKGAAKGAGIEEALHDEISGHEAATVGRGYGRYPVARLKQAVDKVEFDVTIPNWKQP
jgi:integrase